MVAILCYCAIALLLQYRQACDGTGAYALRSCEVRAASVAGISRSTALSSSLPRLNLYGVGSEESESQSRAGRSGFGRHDGTRQEEWQSAS
ncbi:hypothetical protein C8Q76DRAFT_717682 [Earliella scabrosa]|nr:hypothetical protein C8Q76DRAFT_717682 [Earliella scabrosa]